MVDEEGLSNDKLDSYVGLRSDRVVASDRVEAGAVRRFVQAIGDNDPVFWDQGYAATTRYRRPVAPPLYVLHASRRPPGTDDPFDLFNDDGDLDGSDSAFVAAGAAETHGSGLPAVDIPLVRRLNGGVEAEFFALAEHGDQIESVAEYVELKRREGKHGPLVFVTTETNYTNQNRRPLATVRTTSIRR